MNQFPLFSNGLQLSNLVVNSNLLHHSWASIFNLSTDITPDEQLSLPFSVRCRAFQHPQANDCTIVAFVTSPSCTQAHLQQLPSGLASSSYLQAAFPLFQFLCTKGNPSFAIHRAAIDYFAFLYHKNQLSQLKTQCSNSKRLIVTGHSLGGSIASLFTLWLLESVDPKTTNYPLCITFGTPLIGDIGLQQAIFQYSDWNSCFFHVVSDQDPIPRVFISSNNPLLNHYKPFGTFMFCSESGCACFHDPDSIIELLAATSPLAAGHQDPYHGARIVNYGSIVDNLKCKVLFNDTTKLPREIADSFQAGIIAQLEAIELGQPQQQQLKNIDIDTLVKKMEENIKTQKRNIFHPSKKLNDMKIYMAHLEWYKKTCKAIGTGYYDSYKTKTSKREFEVAKYKRKLQNYWEDMVAEVEMKPQKEGAAFSRKWLYAGTNYRRMVEPLNIAEHYRDSNRKDYQKFRSEHFNLLEKWLNEDDKPNTALNNAKKQNIAWSLTEDSCFWSNVEEALISCKLLKRVVGSTEDEELMRKNLIEFEKYLMDSFKNYEVSPEIFLGQSSFMKWWREYEEIVGVSYDSPLYCFMENKNYHQYADGTLLFT